MLAGKRTPEEAPICTHISSPLIWEALSDARQLKGFRPDLAQSQLRPGGYHHHDGHLSLFLHDLFLRQELLHEMEGTVLLSGQEDHLQETCERGGLLLTVLFVR